ncbi:MAG: NeuD/PglB/VioB family sugar acetyltransferase [bacterium]|nr:NeuD/PglB/VioB family sugar acetyltransferase [bacterium]
MKEIILIGSGGHCRSIIDIIELVGEYKIAGIVDLEERLGQSVLGYKVIATLEDLEKLRKHYEYVFIAIGQVKPDPIIRINIYNKIKNLNYKVPIIISPRAYVSKHSIIEEGTVVMHDAFINSNVKVGKNCIINTKAIIEHDCIIGDFCHISTGAIVNGGVVVGNGCFIGSNATVVHNIKIPDNSFIKAASLVK